MCLNDFIRAKTIMNKAIFNNQNSIVEVQSAENYGTEFEITIHKVIV